MVDVTKYVKNGVVVVDSQPFMLTKVRAGLAKQRLEQEPFFVSFSCGPGSQSLRRCTDTLWQEEIWPDEAISEHASESDAPARHKSGQTAISQEPSKPAPGAKLK